MSQSNIKALPRPENPHAADVEEVIRAALEQTPAAPHRAAVVFLIDNVGETYLRFYGATRTELAGALFRTATAVAAWDDEG
jgi:hypothetical protein